MFSAESSVFARKPAVGLDSMSFLNSRSSCVEIRITLTRPIGRETSGEVETAVLTEVDVDESDVGPQLLNLLNGLAGRGRRPNDRDSLTRE